MHYDYCAWRLVVAYSEHCFDNVEGTHTFVTLAGCQKMVGIAQDSISQFLLKFSNAPEWQRFRLASVPKQRKEEKQLQILPTLWLHGQTLAYYIMK